MNTTKLWRTVPMEVGIIARMCAAPYDAIASEYYDPAHTTSRNFDQATTAARELLGPFPPDGIVLEVGAGRGRSAEFLGIDSAKRVVHLDNSSRMLELQPREPSLLRVLHDAESLPFAEAQFSGVTAFLCDPFLGLNFLAEARRIMQKGARLVATTPSDTWAAGLRPGLELDGMETRFVLASGDGEVRVPSAIYTTERLRAMLELVGFSEVAINGICLPRDAEPVSPDLTESAKSLGVDLYELPILYVVSAVA